MKKTYHSFEYWSSHGYKIKKGSKSLCRNKYGVPLFGMSQVQKIINYKRGDIEQDYDNGCYGGDPMDYGNS
jgi:hypothetical protein